MQRNEILAIARMKSANADEIFGLPQRKSNPRIAEAISFEQSENFILRSNISCPKGILQILKGFISLKKASILYQD
ncbi:MAG: hypothetical protein II359_07885 [Clostridia bacterium]|nr:hypothetical protein [Clostridia bacterium]